MSAHRLRVAHHVACTEAEGPHRRVALWTRGCHLRCPGCCNQELFDSGDAPGEPVDALVATLAASRRTHGVEGLTIVGGEPLEQLTAVANLCKQTQRLGLGVIVFTGYRLHEARALPGFDDLQRVVDTLVDGRFDVAAPEPAPAAGGRRFLGSRNQRLHHFSRRYADPTLWRGRAAPGVDVELHLPPDPDAAPVLVGAPRLSARLARALRPPREP